MKIRPRGVERSFAQRERLRETYRRPVFATEPLVLVSHRRRNLSNFIQNVNNDGPRLGIFERMFALVGGAVRSHKLPFQRPRHRSNNNVPSRISIFEFPIDSPFVQHRTWIWKFLNFPSLWERKRKRLTVRSASGLWVYCNIVIDPFPLEIVYLENGTGVWIIISK